MNLSHRLQGLAAVLVAAVALLLPGPSCAEDSGRRVYQLDRDAAWRIVQKQLNDAGRVIKNQDKESGTIQTEWTVLNEVGVFSRGWRVRENIQLEAVSDAATEISIKLVFQKKSGRSPWEVASTNNDYTPILLDEFFRYIDGKIKK